MRARNLARRQPLVARLAAIVDIGRMHLGAVGELSQQVKDLCVPVLRHQPVDVVSPTSTAWLANDRHCRLPNVRQGECVFWHPADDSAAILE
jgi:hypothetical protein